MSAIYKPIPWDELDKMYLHNPRDIAEAIKEFPDYPICFVAVCDPDSTDNIKLTTSFDVEVSDVLYFRDESTGEDFFVQDEEQLIMCLCDENASDEEIQNVLDYYEPYWRKFILISAICF